MDLLTGFDPSIDPSSRCLSSIRSSSLASLFPGKDMKYQEGMKLRGLGDSNCGAWRRTNYNKLGQAGAQSRPTQLNCTDNLSKLHLIVHLILLELLNQKQISKKNLCTAAKKDCNLFYSFKNHRRQKSFASREIFGKIFWGP